MDVVFGWLFVSTFLSKVIQIESSLEIVVGHLRVLRKHTQLRQCAVKALQKHVYVGARISDETGRCDGLPHSWGRNQTIESGYGYVENVHVRINYEPPLEVMHEVPAQWRFPGVLNTGAKMDIHVTWEKFDTAALIFGLSQNYYGFVNRLDISCYPKQCEAIEYNKLGWPHEVVGPNTVFELPRQFRTSNRWKISLVFRRNTLQILVDDEVVMSKELNVLRPNYLRMVYVETNVAKEKSALKPRIRRFEFTNLI